MVVKSAFLDANCLQVTIYPNPILLSNTDFHDMKTTF